LGVDITNAGAGELVSLDEPHDFRWRGDSGLWQLAHQVEHFLAGLQVSERELAGDPRMTEYAASPESTWSRRRR